MPLIRGQLSGKYRRLLIAHDTLPAEAERLAPALARLREMYAEGQLTDAEVACWFVLLFAAERTRARVHRRAHDTLAAKLAWLQNEDSPPPRASDAIAKLNVYGMPGMVWQALGDWLHGRTALRLKPAPPSPQDMLAMQANGSRIVTIDLNAAITGLPVALTRDAFEFALHDLGHAYAFYLPEYQPEGQVEFFNLLQRDLPHLGALAHADEKFAADLEYCMADMNTHPEHLRQYLRGVIVEAFDRQRRDPSARDYSEAALESLLTSLASLAAPVRLPEPV